MGVVHQFWDSYRQGQEWAEYLDSHFRSRRWRVEPVSDWMEKAFGIDRHFYWKGSGLLADACISVEYKCDKRAADTGRLALEVNGSNRDGRRGWFITSRAQILVTVTPLVKDPAGRTVLYWFDLAALKLAAIRDGWAERYGVRQTKNRDYVTENVCVPVGVIEKAFPFARRTMQTPDGW